MTRLGYQIPNFTYPDTTPRQLFGSVVAQAQAAEEAGFDRVMVMDHFYQLPMLGAPEEPMFECYVLLAAQYADESNIGGQVSDVPHKLEVLAEHCERLGRDRSEIAVSKQMTCCVAPTREEAERDLVRMAEIKGWNEERVELAKTMLVFGDPDSVGEQLTAVKATGVDGFTINLAVNGYQTDRVALLGEIANKVLG